MKKIISILAAIAVMVSFSACSEKTGGASAPEVNAPDTKPEALTSHALTHEGTKPAPVTTFRDIEAEYDMAVDCVEGGIVLDSTGVPSEEASGSYSEAIDSGAVDSGGTNELPEYQSGVLTAGLWDDNDHWSFWNNLYQSIETGWSDYCRMWDKTLTKRYFATVCNGTTPLENITVCLLDNQGNEIWRTKTDNEGKCYLFADATEDGVAKITANVGGSVHELPVVSTNESYNFKLNEGENAEQQLDLLLMIDTTGSMGDELGYLKAELDSIIRNVAEDNEGVKIRVSVNFYRDEGDEYVVRAFDFTDDIAQAVKDLGEQRYDGGGDYPEAVHTALANAVSEHSWDENSTKLMLFVLDAPCHENSQVLDSVNSSVKLAAEKGIRIIPVVSSGADKATEYLMRDMAIKTGGKYVFLTDHSGVSVGGHIEPTIGEYEVKKLNVLLAEVISAYLDRSKVAEYTDIEVEAPNDPVKPLGAVEIELTGCTATQDGSVTLEIAIHNKSSREICYGAGPQMLARADSELDGGWAEIPVLRDVSWIEIAYCVEAGSTTDCKIYLEDFFGKLEKGEYRFYFTDLGTFGDSPEVPYVDFTVA